MYYQTINPEKKRLEYEERKERLNAVLMERRAAKATNEREKGDARLFWIGLFVAPLMLVIFFLTYYRICSSK